MKDLFLTFFGLREQKYLMKKGDIYGRCDELIIHLYSSFKDQKFLIGWLNDNFGLKNI